MKFVAGFIVGVFVGHPLISKAYRSLPIRDRIIIGVYNQALNVVEALDPLLPEPGESK